METLEYHGRPLSPAPINVGIGITVERLLDGHPVVVILEPGDATRYRLCIVPCWSRGVLLELGDVGIPPMEAMKYLIVTKLDDRGGPSFFATPWIRPYDIEGIENEWTCTFLCWWLRGLWEVINVEKNRRSQDDENRRTSADLRGRGTSDSVDDPAGD